MKDEQILKRLSAVTRRLRERPNHFLRPCNEFSLNKVYALLNSEWKKKRRKTQIHWSKVKLPRLGIRLSPVPPPSNKPTDFPWDLTC